MIKNHHSQYEKWPLNFSGPLISPQPFVQVFRADDGWSLGLVEDLGIDSPLAALQEEYQNVWEEAGSAHKNGDPFDMYSHYSYYCFVGVYKYIYIYIQ